MKASAKVLSLAVAYTFAFYLAVRLLLPPPPPTQAEVALYAAVGLLLAFATRWLWHRVAQRRAAKPAAPRSKAALLLAGALVLAAMHLTGCNAAPPPRSSSAAAPPGSRVTGTATLLPNQEAVPGYGLYSYALLSHRPSSGELPQYRAFIRALLALPRESDLSRYIDRRQINITYFLLTSKPGADEQNDPDKLADFILAHYDVARSAAIRASLPERSRGGPMLVSVLDPLRPGTAPRPVLVQDLTAVDPQVVASYVQQFTVQAGQPQFWQADSLAAFALKLRNLLLVSAGGLDQSRTGVDSWIKFFKG